MWLPSALTRVVVSTAGSRGMWPVTALIVQVSMGGGGGAWGPLPNRGLPVSEPGESAGGGPPVVEAHHTEPVSVAGVGPSSQTLSSPAPPFVWWGCFFGRWGCPRLGS